MNCPRCGARDCNDPDSKACSDNCITRLERELAAYQNAEMPEANHAELVKHMREESQAGGELDCPLCGQAADYLDALAKHYARLTVLLQKVPRILALVNEQHSLELQRSGGNFLIAVALDPWAIAWQELEKERSVIDAEINTALAAWKEKAE